jgi:hypothetical protein
VGASVGTNEGAVVGDRVGTMDGSVVGDSVGSADGSTVGTANSDTNESKESDGRRKKSWTCKEMSGSEKDTELAVSGEFAWG